MALTLTAAAALAGVLAAGAPAAAAAHPRVAVRGWTVLRVNQTTDDVAPGGTAALCQAIPPTALTARLAATPGVRARVVLRVPGHRPRTRTVALRRRTRVSFTARGLRLRDEAFPAGTYRLTVRRDGRTVARATLRLAGAGAC